MDQGVRCMGLAPVLMGGSFHSPNQVISGALEGSHLARAHIYERLLIKLQIITLPMAVSEDEMKSSRRRKATTETLFTPRTAIF